MIIELFTVASILIGGSLLLRMLGIRDWGLPAVGFLAGMCVFIIVGAVQALTPVPTDPRLTIALTAIAPLGTWSFYFLQGRDVKINVHVTLAVVLAVMLAVVFFRGANLVNWHTDTFRYLMTSSLIASDNYDSVSVNLVTKRLLSVPLIHAPAQLSGEWYLRSITPLLAISTLATIAWLAWRGLRNKVSNKTILLFIAAGLLLLATTNRFVFHALYINGHLLFGALLLLIAGCSWLMATDKTAPKRALITLQAIALPAIIVTRPEGSLVAVVALLPLLLSGVVTFRIKAVLLSVLGASTLLWQLFVASVYMRDGIELSLEVYGMILAGLLMLAAIPLLKRKGVTAKNRLLIKLAEGGLWAAVLLLALRAPDLLIRSLDATINNVALGGGSWGLSFMILFFLVVGMLALTKAPGQVHLRFPLTTFPPLALLLVLIQEGAYRVGDGDSLNRMWMQFIPLAVLYIIVAMAAGQWRFKRSDIKKLKQKLLPRKKTRPSRA